MATIISRKRSSPVLRRAIACAALVVFSILFIEWFAIQSDGTHSAAARDISSPNSGESKQRGSVALAAESVAEILACTSCRQWEKREEAWNRRRKERMGLLRKVRSLEKNSVNFLLQPEYLCHEGIPERIGGTEDGGKFVCLEHVPKESTNQPCLIYSVGSADDFSFEEAVRSQNSNCEVHIFDPTVSLTARGTELLEQIGAKYHIMGVSYAEVEKFVLGPLRPLTTIMKQLNHSGQPLTILKIDCEACEWMAFTGDIFPAMKNGTIRLEQLQIELHLDSTDISKLYQFFKMADENGLRMVSAEYNRWAPPVSYCAEFSFVLSERPVSCALPQCRLA